MIEPYCHVIAIVGSPGWHLIQKSRPGLKSKEKSRKRSDTWDPTSSNKLKCSRTYQLQPFKLEMRKVPHLQEPSLFWPYMTLPKRSPKTKDALGKSASLKRIDQKNYAAMHVITLLKSEGGRVCSNPSLWQIQHVWGRIYQNEKPPLATKRWGSGCSCLTTPWRFEATQLPKQNSQLNVTVLSLTILIQWSAGILKSKELPLFKITRNNSWKTFHIPKPKVPVEKSP